MTATEIHAVLLAEANRVGLPKYYTRDLTFHDLNELTETKTQHFIYVLRTCGTFLIPLDTGKNQHSFLFAIGKYSDDEMLWYEFKDGALESINKAYALKVSSCFTR